VSARRHSVLQAPCSLLMRYRIVAMVTIRAQGGLLTRTAFATAAFAATATRYSLAITRQRKLRYVMLSSCSRV
jgi:hypothetical protein